jgi:hypothetical protein
MNEYQVLIDIIAQLQAVINRESKRHFMDEHLIPGDGDRLEEIIDDLRYLVDAEPTDEQLRAAQDVASAAERWAEAHRQHQELHS